MKFASLGSGSEGNALLITAASGTTRTTVMLDCGFSVKETERRMARIGMAAAELSAIVITHEHSDHVSGAFKFARRYHVPVWLSYGTFQAVQHDCKGVDVRFCRDGVTIPIGDLELLPYTVPHDAREPVQYVASDGRSRLGVLTDAGHSTPHMVGALAGCEALILECNHDRQMLANSIYPPSLKRRIGGIYGHLSNDSSTQILSALDRSRLRMVIGAHLSQQNNTAALATAAITLGLDGADAQIRIADQSDGFDWVDLA
ncbi:MBL fold metallo-hydrolase [Actimicrobium sp. CCI2.3]|uniref:MBL fold metallo-hydrolase n=1 Tax=Actimicrobium sp. CCI2.3 TaxID=3048616 RepID=UPI002AB4FCBA|nr:MBL fold metallo-hydrolase [Actimicrobium sp. CCI2.3]MDY7574675.1 MBL fold metallo-hydrolase [Actimicrobium sp. CCI2.3]MEB0020368.1 MBL fold metallo-hydrolase [Actimicrobium sp. CCI2.3]